MQQQITLQVSFIGLLSLGNSLLFNNRIFNNPRYCINENNMLITWRKYIPKDAPEIPLAAALDTWTLYKMSPSEESTGRIFLPSLTLTAACKASSDCFDLNFSAAKWMGSADTCTNCPRTAVHSSAACRTRRLLSAKDGKSWRTPRNN